MSKLVMVLKIFFLHHLSCQCFCNLDIKGVVHFKKKKNVDNLLTPISSKKSMSFFLQSKIN